MIIIIKSLFAIGITFLISLIGYYKKSLSLSGAFFGILVGFFHALSSYTILASLFTFFIFGSLISKYGKHMKLSIKGDLEDSQRTWIQVFSNSFGSTLSCFVYISEVGIRLYDIPVNYQTNPIGSMCVIVAVSNLAASCGDTFASEIGSVFSRGDPRLITNLKKVPRETNGGVSITGTLASAIGGTLVGIAAFVTNSFTCNYFDSHDAPPQWPLIVIGTLSGLLGSFIDSVLGAIFQYSGLNIKTGQIVSFPGPHVRHISGWNLLDNHNVNLISSTLTALIMAFGACYMWPILPSIQIPIDLSTIMSSMTGDL